MICWYCSIREADEKHTFAFDMFGDLDAQEMPVQTDVAYKVRHVRVPRCADCHNRHRLAWLSLLFAAGMAVLAFVASLNSIFSWTSPWLAGLLLGLSTGLLFAALLYSRAVQSGIYSVARSRTKYPEVQELFKLNYQFGARPKKK
jgi:hypothetical protein